MLVTAGGVLAAGVLAAALMVLGAAVAQRALGGASASGRAASAVVVALATACLSFFLLGAVRGFRLDVALGLAVAALVAVGATLDRGGAVRRQLAADLQVAAATSRELGPVRWLALACTVPVLLRVLRGLVAPPLAWDALTYHLFRAGRWVQEGGLTSTAGPDAAAYYDHFSPYGDVLWAWAMLPVRGDAVLALAGLAVWLAVALGAYACARALDARPRPAALLALAISAPPAVSGFVTSGYVDAALLATFLLGTSALLRFGRSGAAPELVVGAVAFGLAAGVKQSGLLFLPLGAAFAAVAAARSGGARRPVRAALVFSAVALAVAAPPCLRALVQTGNPLYPLAVGTWLDGNPQLAAVTRGPGTFAPERIWTALFGLGAPAQDSDRLGFGPGGIAVLALGAAGAIPLLRRRRLAECALLLALAAVSFGATLLPSVASLWSAWAGVSPRLVAPAFAAIALLAAGLDRPAAQVALAVAAAAGAALGIPRGWGAVDLEALRLAWPALLLLAGAGAAALRARSRPPLAAALAASGLVASLALLSGPRAQLRYRYYEAAADGQVFELHGLHPWASKAWPIWAALDGAEPRRIAFTAGFDGVGHNWYRYPLLGARLQNAVAYVAPTRDGRVVDYATLRGDALDPVAWVRRLLDAGVDRVVVDPPGPPEGPWVQSSPALFTPVACGRVSQGCAFALERERAAMAIGPR